MLRHRNSVGTDREATRPNDAGSVRPVHETLGMADGIGKVPRHPSADRRSLVLWRGYHCGVSIEELDRRVTGCIAMPTSHAALEAKVVAAAHAAGIGVAVASQSWRNQLDADDPRRTGTFAT